MIWTSVTAPNCSKYRLNSSETTQPHTHNQDQHQRQPQPRPPPPAASAAGAAVGQLAQRERGRRQARPIDRSPSMTNGTRWFWGTERVLEGTSLLVAPRARRVTAAGAAGATYLRSLCRSGRPQRSSWFGSLASRWLRGGSLAWPRSIGAKNNARDNARWQNEIEPLARENAELDARTNAPDGHRECVRSWRPGS